VNGMGSHERPIEGLKDEWLTPRHVTDALGPFDLDPCSPVSRPWSTAATHYTIEDDGLSKPWHGFVWCNPPYGRLTWIWLERLAKHGNGIALVFARTEVEGFVAQVWQRADAVLFLDKRLTFHHVDGTPGKANAGAPSCLVGYGRQAVDRLETCGLGGSLVSGWHLVAA
jgi:hypothetical protein